MVDSKYYYMVPKSAMDPWEVNTDLNETIVFNYWSSVL